MKPANLLKAAKAFPEKPRLETHRNAILELKRKGLSYREIADFLKEHGMNTDHTAVYRLVVEGNPLLCDLDGLMLIGEHEYEIRKGCLIRPYRTGLVIRIQKPGEIYVPENEERISSVWLEAQFELSAVPNHCWIQRLSQSLDMLWNPDEPRSLQGRFGSQVKFEGREMALVCKQFNLEQEVTQLVAAVRKTTEFFVSAGESLLLRQKALAERKHKVLENMTLSSTDDPDEVYEEHLANLEKRTKELKKKFHSLL